MSNDRNIAPTILEKGDKAFSVDFNGTSTYAPGSFNYLFSGMPMPVDVNSRITVNVSGSEDTTVTLLVEGFSLSTGEDVGLYTVDGQPCRRVSRVESPRWLDRESSICFEELITTPYVRLSIKVDDELYLYGNVVIDGNRSENPLPIKTRKKMEIQVVGVSDGNPYVVKEGHDNVTVQVLDANADVDVFIGGSGNFRIPNMPLPSSLMSLDIDREKRVEIQTSGSAIVSVARYWSVKDV